MGISRREFSKLGAMGLAARMLPSVGAGAQGDERKVRYADRAGTKCRPLYAWRAAKFALEDYRAGERAIAMRQSGLRRQYGAPKSSIYSYEDMDRFRENKAIDAVYVALPNSMHAEYTIRSAKAGKHVLCEKPMSISVSEVGAMIGGVQGGEREADDCLPAAF